VRPCFRTRYPDAAAERDAADADRAGVAEAEDQAACHEGRGDRRRGGARLDPGGPGGCVDVDRVQTGEVEDDPAVVGGERRVPPAAYREVGAGLAGVPDHRGHVRGPGSPYDERRALVDAAEEHRAGGVVRRVVRADHGAGDTRPICSHARTSEPERGLRQPVRTHCRRSAASSAFRAAAAARVGSVVVVIRRRVVVSGRVQGVFFRDTCRREAARRGVAGWVRNRADGTVEAVFEGRPDAVDALVAWARTGPPDAAVTGVDVRAEPLEGATGFEIRGTQW
jgi:acylphosphatase